MNEATRWRRELAERMAALYVEQHVPEVDVMFYKDWYRHRRPVNVR